MASDESGAIVELIKGLGLNTPAVSIVMLLILVGPYISKALTWFHGTRQARKTELEWLVKTIKDPVVQGSRYLFEQTFEKYIGVALTYDELNALLDKNNPTLEIQRYCANRRLVQIGEGSEYSYREKFANNTLRQFYRSSWLILYCVSAGVAGALFMLMQERGIFMLWGATHFVVLLFMAIGILSLHGYNEYVCAARLMSTSENDFVPGCLVKSASRALKTMAGLKRLAWRQRG